MTTLFLVCGLLAVAFGIVVLAMDGRRVKMKK